MIAERASSLRAADEAGSVTWCDIGHCEEGGGGGGLIIGDFLAGAERRCSSHEIASFDTVQLGQW